MNDAPPIDIACAVNEAYVPHCATMLASLLAAHPHRTLRIHFFHPEGPGTPVFETLRRFVESRGATLIARAIPLATVARAPVSDYLPAIVWFRALLPELLPDLDRVLYLDADLIVTARLDELWETNLDQHALAAVTNPISSYAAGWPRHIGLPGDAAYFNSGVMLLNLDWLRRNGSSAQVLDFARLNPDKIRWGDQCALNAVLHAHRQCLPLRWNVLNSFFAREVDPEIFNGADLDAAVANPAVVHFEGPGAAKPWHYLCIHPRRRLYRQHRRQTPWRDYVPEGRTPVDVLRKVYRLLRQATRSLIGK